MSFKIPENPWKFFHEFPRSTQDAISIYFVNNLILSTQRNVPPLKHSHCLPILWILNQLVQHVCTVQQVLSLDAETQQWRLVTIDASRPLGWAPGPVQRLVRGTAFHISMHLLIITDAIVAASRCFPYPYGMDSFFCLWVEFFFYLWIGMFFYLRTGLHFPFLYASLSICISKDEWDYCNFTSY